MDVAALTTSGLALLGVALGAWLGARSSHSQWLKDMQLAACQRLMDRYADLYEQLALSRRGEVFDQSWASWNQALTGVSFVCARSVVNAAFALDEQLWRADWAIRGGQTGQLAWIEQRRPLDAARGSFIHAVRRQATAKYRGSVRTSGRPADDDPMWRTTPKPAPPRHEPDTAVEPLVDPDGQPAGDNGEQRTRENDRPSAT
jgi:hypothetical protein